MRLGVEPLDLEAGGTDDLGQAVDVPQREETAGKVVVLPKASAFPRAARDPHPDAATDAHRTVQVRERERQVDARNMQVAVVGPS